MHSVLLLDPYNERAIYALGSYARLFRNEGDTRTATALGEELVAKLLAATGRTATVVSLRGIANSGYDGALGHLRPFLFSSDEGVRGTATRALQSMRAPRVDELIATKITTDKSPIVQIAALDAANVRSPNDTLVAAVLKAAVDSEPRVRFRSVDVIDRWLPVRPELSRTLATVAQADAEPRVRERAAAILSKRAPEKSAQ